MEATVISPQGAHVDSWLCVFWWRNNWKNYSEVDICTHKIWTSNTWNNSIRWGYWFRRTDSIPVGLCQAFLLVFKMWGNRTLGRCNSCPGIEASCSVGTSISCDRLKHGFQIPTKDMPSYGSLCSRNHKALGIYPLFTDFQARCKLSVTGHILL